MLQDKPLEHPIQAERTRRALYSIDLVTDYAVDPTVNRAVLVDNHPSFGVWRPPTVKPIGRRPVPSQPKRYIPVISPLTAVFVDLRDLTIRSLRWTWRAIDDRSET